MKKARKTKVRYDGGRPLGVLPYICAVSIALMYTVCRSQAVICSALMCAAACGVFMLICAMQKRPVGSAVVTALATLMCFGGIAVVSWSFVGYIGQVEAAGSSADLHGFAHFLFSASAYFDWIYAIGTVLMFAVIIGFICCYFSVVMPRIYYLLLPAFIPIILSARTAGGLPLPLTALLFGTFILAVCSSAVPCENADATVFEDKSAHRTRLLAAAILSVAAMLIAVSIPRSEATPFGRYLDSMLKSDRGFYNNAGKLGNFSTSSSVNNGSNSASDEVLFVVQTRTPMPLDRWSFDVYNGAEGWTYLPSAYNTGYADWEYSAEKLSYARLFSQLITGAREGKLSKYADGLLRLDRHGAVKGEMLIRITAGGASAVVMHPVSAYDVDIIDFDSNIYRTVKGETFVTDDIPAQARYLIAYYADEPCADYCAVVQQYGLVELVSNAYLEGVIDYSTMQAFLDEYSYAGEYWGYTEYDGISDEMFRLAREITADCETDYEKYKAIERWFGENGFLYDLDFVPQSAETEYFVFESKRGICSDFATAATLLARATGLPARYTEGFALTEDCRDENGVYNVTAAQAHAYAQVYVRGCGWLNLDATAYVERAEGISSTYIALAALIAVAVIAVAVLIIVFRKRIGLLFFAMGYRLRGTRSRIKAVYLRTRAIACELSGSSAAAVTCGETRAIITNMLSMPKEAEFICTAADRLMYSDSEPDVDTMELYRSFRRICKRKRVLKR